jgi:hypothetical protein
MANRLEFSTSIDGSGFARGIRDMERLAGISGGRMSNALSGGFMSHGGAGGGISGIIRESLVIIREFGRGNLTRIPGSATLLAQYLGVINVLYKSTAAGAVAAAAADRKLTEQMALAAVVARDKAAATKAALVASNLDGGASLRLALADNTAAVAATRDAEAQNLKADASERSARVALATASTSITALGWITIAAVALAVPIFLLARHFERLAASEKNAAELTDITSRSFEEQAKAIKSAAEAAQQYADWKRDLDESSKGSKDATEEGLRTLREEAALEKELAEAEGKSRVQLAAIEEVAQRRELEFLNKSIDALKTKIDLDKKAEDAAQARLNQFSTGIGPDSEAAMNAANKKAEEAATVIDALKTAIAGHRQVATGQTETVEGQAGYGPTVTQVMRPANSTDVLTVKIGEKSYTDSLANVTAAYNKDAAEAARLAGIQKEIADLLKDKKTLTEKDVEQINKLQSEAHQISNDLDLNPLRQQVAEAEDSKKTNLSAAAGRGGSPDSLVRVGNFLGTARGQIEVLTAEHVKIAREHLGVSKSIDRTLKRQFSNVGNDVSYSIS